MANWINHYLCPCGEKWDDESESQCNDRCPKCNREIEPYISDDGSVSEDRIDAAFVKAMSNMNLSLFQVEVEAVGDDESTADLGIVEVIANDDLAAKTKALELLWDSRLDSAGCSPRYHTERLDSYNCN